MKTLPAALITQKNTMSQSSSVGGWLWLVTFDRDGTNYLYYCGPGVREDVTFDSQTYTAKNMEVRPPSTDMGGSTRNFQISIENVDQIMVADLENGEFLDRPVILRLVHADDLTVEVPPIYGVVIEANTTEKYATFVCGAYDLRAVTVPKDTYSRERCRWLYKSDECGSVSGLSTCPKDLVGCDARGVKERFGGFPGMPMLKP